MCPFSMCVIEQNISDSYNSFKNCPHQMCDCLLCPVCINEYVLVKLDNLFTPHPPGWGTLLIFEIPLLLYTLSVYGSSKGLTDRMNPGLTTVLTTEVIYTDQ